MKKIYAFMLAGILVMANQLTGITNSSTPPAAKTGAPGETTCNDSGCHSGPLNAGGGSVSLINPPASYVPGTKYTLQLQITDATRTRFGFQVTALGASNTKQGNFSLLSTGNTNIQNVGTRQYVSHQNANSTKIWTFDWTAPATNVGPITFYMAGNAANNNGSTNGDNIYNASFVMQPGTSTGILDAGPSSAVSLYPNPATDKLFISGDLLAQATELRISNIIGKTVRKMPAIQLADNLEVNISDLNSGIYLFHFKTKDGKQITKKFVVE